ncbi:translation initiation factor [Taibaiella chishuiensis]|uniref:Translation initiation factor 1 n=1 Tax=Taibaiella chishuiensis TaxID=1434707 RepID=A0A2P8DD79_9BACT|nr:translation initiation factor [Taibaiella chishuiensis]PSK95176.1 translation initiation factor 1 [Taibaiella chishuiensis]
MTKKKLNSFSGLVFSTNPEMMREEEPEAQETLPPAQQKLKVKLDRKQRAGKTVTLVEGFSGSEEALEELGKKLKTKCGAGGSAKDGLILIQGDYKLKVTEWLKDWGYSQTKMV